MEISGGRKLPEKKYTRRGFLRKAIGLGDEGGPSLFNTAATSAAISLGLAAITPPLVELEKSSGIRLGGSNQNRRELERLDSDPARLYFLMSVVAPLFEEPIFRILPNLLLPQRLGIMWRVGIPSSAIFAESHAVEVNEQTKQIVLDPNTVPIIHFGFGLYLWKLARERGYLHAIIAHSIANTVQASLFLVGILKPISEPRVSRKP